MIRLGEHDNIEARCCYHVVFCPKYRRRLLMPPVSHVLEEMLPELVKKWGGELIDISVTTECVQLLISLAPRCNIHRLIWRIKWVSSWQLLLQLAWLRARTLYLWDKGYYVETVGKIDPKRVNHFVAKTDLQKHHDRADQCVPQPINYEKETM